MAMAKYRNLFLIFALLLTLSSSESVINTLIVNNTFLVESFRSICGYYPFCQDGRLDVSTNGVIHPCQKCSCDEKCQASGNCCSLMNSCIPTTALKSGAQRSQDLMGVHMIDQCPNSVGVRPATVEPVNRLNYIEMAPVTSLKTNFTYRNKRVAECNGIKDYVSWTLATDCMFDLNLLSSPIEIWESAEKHGCGIYYEYPMYNSNIHECEVKEAYISKCNVTGLWSAYNADIEWACRNTELPYNAFRNVFCYMCNAEKELPSFRRNHTIINDKRINNYVHLRHHIDKSIEAVYSVSRDIVNETNTLLFLMKIKRFNICQIIGKTNLKLIQILHNNQVCEITNTIYTLQNEFVKENTFLRNAVIGVYQKLGDGTADSINIESTTYPSIHNDVSANEQNKSTTISTGLYNTRLDTGYCRPFWNPFTCVSNIDARSNPLMVSDCPYGGNSELRKLCKSSPSTYVLNVPVYSVSASISFANIFCLLCYDHLFRQQKMNVTLADGYLLPWDIEQQCPVVKNMSQFNDMKNMTKNRDLGCKIRYIHPHIVEKDWSSTITTGVMRNTSRGTQCQWNVRYANSPNEVCICEMPLLPNNACQLSNCMTCNSESDVAGTIHVRYSNSYRRYFSIHDTLNRLIKDSKAFGDFDQGQCRENHVWDPYKATCRRVDCLPGKRIRNGKCVPLLTTSRDLEYILAVEVTVTQMFANRSLSVTTPQNIMDSLITKYLMLTSHINTTVVHAYLACATDCSTTISILNINLSFSIHIALKIDRNQQINRQRLDDELLKISTSSWTTQIEAVKVTFSSKLSVNAIMLPAAFHTMNPFVYCKRHLMSNYSFNVTSDFYFVVSKLLVCQQITLSNAEYKKHIHNMSVTVPHLHKNFDAFSFLQIKKYDIKICLDDNIPALTKQSNIEFALNIFSVICTVFSLIGILLTFTAFYLLPKIQTLPGKLLMCLMANLAVAQIFTITVGQVQKGVACAIFGGLQHYFWLATFSFSFACSFHMYRLFSSITPIYNRKSRERRLFALYVSVSSVIPMGFVIGYILNVLIYYPGTTNVYSAKGCFIYTITNKVVYFMAPTLCVSVCNLCFFVKTYFIIKSVPVVEGNSMERKHFRTFSKLFCITCSMWTLQYIDGLFPISLFSFLVTFLNGSQGVFICFSYVAEKTNLAYFRNKLLDSLSSDDLSEKSNRKEPKYTEEDHINLSNL